MAVASVQNSQNVLPFFEDCARLRKTFSVVSRLFVQFATAWGKNGSMVCFYLKMLNAVVAVLVLKLSKYLTLSMCQEQFDIGPVTGNGSSLIVDECYIYF